MGFIDTYNYYMIDFAGKLTHIIFLIVKVSLKLDRYIT